MAHPFNQHRQDKVEKSRVAHITRGYAAGGAVKADAPERKSGGKVKAAIVDAGAKAAKKADRPARAKGGRVKHKNKGTNVNVIVGAQHPPAGPVAGVGPMPGAMPPMPPHPPVMPPPGAGAPMPPTSPPIAAMPPHAAGGRAFAKGGRVKGTKVYEEGVSNGTPVQHDAGKSDLKDMNRGKPMTYKTGGAVESTYSVSPATKLPGGAGGGEGRLAKASRAKRK